MNPSTRTDKPRTFRNLNTRRQWKAVRDALHSVGYGNNKISVYLFVIPGVSSEYRVRCDNKEVETFANAILSAERLWELAFDTNANTLKLIARGLVRDKGLADRFEAARRLGASDAVLREMIEPVRPTWREHRGAQSDLEPIQDGR